METLFIVERATFIWVANRLLLIRLGSEKVKIMEANGEPLGTL